jgi:GMP synthase-like glutamine amidotransferase
LIHAAVRLNFKLALACPPQLNPEPAVIEWAKREGGEVELTDDAADDPVLGRLPQRFEAFQWHYYTYGVPAGATELARSAACTQAFRLGSHVWGVQFHPEVTRQQVESWIGDATDPPPDPEALREATRPRIERWNELGRQLCAAFVEAAERAAVAA